MDAVATCESGLAAEVQAVRVALPVVQRMAWVNILGAGLTGRATHPSATVGTP